MANIPLTFKTVTEIVGIEGVGIIVLVDKDEKRQLSLMCDKDTLQQFKLRHPHVKQKKEMLPEVLWQIIRYYSAENYEVIINSLIEGEYRAILYNTDSLDLHSLRGTDAILLALIAHLPIYVDERLMQLQSMPYDQTSMSMALPVNVLTKELLQDALERAVHDENYELAAALKAELERRKGVKGLEKENPDTER